MVPVRYRNGCLANLTIKKLSDPVYRRLKKHARLHQRSLNAQVIHMLQSDLDEHAGFEKMRDASGELERFVASLMPLTETVVDASVVVKWFLPEPCSRKALRLLRLYREEKSGCSRVLLISEVSNIFCRRARQGVTTPPGRDESL